MHVLYVLPKSGYFLHGRRGRVAHALGVAEGLAEAGCRVTVVSGGGTAEVFAGVAGVEVTELAARPRETERIWLGRLLMLLENLISSDSGIAAVIVRYATSNARRFVPIIRRCQAPVWCFEVNSLGYHQLARLPMPLRRVVRRFERRTLSVCDLVYVVSSRLAEDVVEGPGKLPRIAVIPNAAALLLSRPQSINDRGAVRFTYLGVFQSYYDFELLLRAFRSIEPGTGAELHLFGDGPQLARLEALAAASKRVYLRGRYDLEQLVRTGELDRNRTVLVLPTSASEYASLGSPIKLYEYMSLGLPIMASRVGQIAETLTDDRTACFYEPGDLASCAEVMKMLCESAELRARIGDNALSEFERCHTWRSRMRELRDALEEAGSRDRRG